MATASPGIFRRDLVVSRQETPEGARIVLKDPGTGRFFRLRDLDYFVAQRLDGSTSLDLIAQEVADRFGVRPAPAVLERFVNSLRRLGLLQEEATQGPRTPSRAEKLRGSLLHLRLTAFDPDHLLDRLVRHVGFCFGPGFLVVTALLIAVGGAIAIANWDDIKRDLVGLYSVEAVLVAWVIISP